MATKEMQYKSALHIREFHIHGFNQIQIKKFEKIATVVNVYRLFSFVIMPSTT